MKTLMLSVTFLAVLALVATAAILTTSFMLPVNDTLFLGGDTVAYAGVVHVVTKVVPPDPIVPPNPIVPVDVHINLAGVSGVGTSGIMYEFVGSANVHAMATTDGHPTEVLAGGFRAVPHSNASPVDPCQVRVTFSLDATGSVSGVSAQLLEDVT